MPSTDTRLGQPTRRFGDDAGDAEVDDERVVALEQDVLWLDIPVNDVVPVRVVQRLRDVDHDSDRFSDWQLFLAAQAVAERLPFDEWHHVEQLAAGASRVVHGQDVGMGQVRGGLDLTQEPFGAKRFGELAIENLDRHHATVANVAREIHDGHATAPDLTVDFVSAR